MASPTPNRGYTYPAHGGAVNAWDSPLNANFDQIDLNVSGYYPITIGSSIGVATFNSSGATIPSTASTITPPSSLAQNLNYTISGTLTNAISLVLPSAGSFYNITNNSSGSFAITALTAVASGTGSVIGQSGSNSLYCDGTNVKQSNTNAGRVQTVLGTPNGTLAGYAGPITGSFSDVAWDATNQLLYVCSVTGSSSSATWVKPVATVTRGFDTPINLSISATHTGGNLLQIALKTTAGADPTTSSPITTEFQTVSGANTTGAVTSVNITSAMSMTTNATGASLGSSNSTPFRIWLALFNNAGTAVLAMRNCSTSSNIYALSEYGVASTTSISASATSAGVWYTPNGTTLTNCAFRLIGYIEYTSGLATAGTYTSDPNNVVLFGPGIKKPGDIIQSAMATSSTQVSVTSATFVAFSSPTVSITLSSPINLIVLRASGLAAVTGNLGTLQLGRGASNTFGTAVVTIANTNNGMCVSLDGVEAPGSTGPFTYNVYGKNGNGAQTTYWNVNLQSSVQSTGYIRVEEIMG